LRPATNGLGLDVGARGQGGSWRVGQLEDVPALLGKERQLTALVSRDRRLLRLPMTVPQPSTVWRLEVPKDRQPHEQRPLWPAA